MSKINWQPIQPLLVALFPTIDNEIIADKLGVSVSAIRSRAQVLGLKKINHRWTDADLTYLRANYHQGIKAMMLRFPSRTRWGIISKYMYLTNKDERKPLKK